MTRRDVLLARVQPDGDCLLWTGTEHSQGYGQLSWENKLWLAHRWFFTQLVGPIPADMTLDHVRELCKSKLCVNTDHLEVVTRAENVRRHYAAQTHCGHGHEYTEENTYIHSITGRRGCFTCRHEQSAKWNAKLAARRAEKRSK